MKDERQQLILVDDQDNPTGTYADKGECHFGTGLHHRAFVVVLYNKKREILLQYRKHVRWDKFWDLTAISHVLHFTDKNETYEEAANRSLKDEMGIENIQLEKIGGFNYFAKYHAHCENEYCGVLVGQYNGTVTPNSEVVYDYAWIDEEEFISDVAKYPEKYTPWAIETAEILKKSL